MLTRGVLVFVCTFVPLQYELFVDPRIPFWEFYAYLVVVNWCTSGLSYAVSIYFQPQTATLAAVMLSLVSTMFSGTYPRLEELQTMGDFVMLLSNSSYARWSQEILFLSEMQNENYTSVLAYLGTASGETVTVSTMGASIGGYEPVPPEENVRNALNMLCNLGLIFRVIAFTLMVCCNHAKKK